MYADHLKEFKARKPFAALLESFTEPTNDVSHPRGAGARINGVLEKHADVHESVVLVRDDTPTGRGLVAYAAGAPRIGAEELLRLEFQDLTEKIGRPLEQVGVRRWWETSMGVECDLSVQ